MYGRGRRLRELLQRDEILVAAGAFDPLSARLVEQAGFEACYMTGAGTAHALAGLPDIGLTTLTEMALNAKYMCSSVSIPVVADADTGYGNAINVIRTVREYEQAGLAGFHIEDQVAPKRCGHVAGKECIPLDEMVGKIRAAVAARRDPSTVVIARIDARQPLGYDEAVKRGRELTKAGADLIFIEALESRDEFVDYAKQVDTLLLANMTEFGKTPYMTAAELQSMGYKMVIFAASSLRVALKSMQDFYRDLKRDGTQQGWLDRMLKREELYELIDYKQYTEFEREFLGQAVDPLADRVKR
ncbi:MAG: methylisocitrate lyase [Chloroflexi bacterium]|nr:methylisocitrate lyase [Chloroflexota bacterium]